MKKKTKFVMKCGRCGKEITWFNDVPLTAFCYGTEEKEHACWHKIVPRPHNPYLKPYTNIVHNPLWDLRPRYAKHNKNSK